MNNPSDGTTKPSLCEVGTEVQKTRTYKTPNGETFEITEEEFNVVVAIFDFLRQARDQKSTQAEIEPQVRGSSLEQNEVQSRKAG